MVSIDKIKVPEGRKADPKKVRYLADSIGESGLLHPIGLNAESVLIYGKHRIEAYKLLGLKQIPAVIHDIDSLHAELAAIDENVMRGNPDVLDLAEQLLRRKEIYEELHPDTKQGGRRDTKSNGSNGNNSRLDSFADDCAKRMGVSVETVRKYVKVANNIPQRLRTKLRTVDSGQKITELDAISKLSPKEQEQVVNLLLDGAGSVQEAAKNVKVKNKSEALQNIVARTTKTAKTGGKQEPAESVDTTKGSTQPTQDIPEHIDGDGANGESQDATGQASADKDLDTPVAGADQHDTESGEGGGQGEINAEAEYAYLVSYLAKKLPILTEHMNHIVGKASDPQQAAETLRKAAFFCSTAAEAEAQRIKPREQQVPITSS